jgi:hypothetical protein
VVDPMVLRTFQREVAKQCRYALLSVNFLDQANSVSGPQSQTHVWYAIQNLLIAAGNISKFLWGQKSGSKEVLKKRAQQRRHLRALLGVAENSILKLSPEFRNHFEHLDERIEEWVEESTNHNLADDIIGPPNAIVGLDPRDMMRRYDPSSHILSFRGETFEIVPLVRAIEALLPIAEREVNKPHWETPNAGGKSDSSSGRG